MNIEFDWYSQMFSCCKIYAGRKDENTGEVTINKITYHGCEKDLAPAIGNHVEVGGVFPFVYFVSVHLFFVFLY